MTYFRKQAAAYAEFRPDYPEELFSYAASLVTQHHLAWDCATGNGQAATRLAEYFDQVIATDISPEQIAHARPQARVEYRVAPAEASGLAEHAVNLVTVCQALHWLKRPQFFQEVRRVLGPGGAFMATLYGDAHVTDNSEVDQLLQVFSKGTMGPYWPAGRKLVDEHYGRIEFPFPLLSAPKLTLSKQWTLRQLAGYMRSWSSTTRYVEQHGGDPVGEVEAQMEKHWGDPLTPRRIEWPFRIFAGRP